MDDGLAEKLFNAFWDPLVARGWPRPCAWDELHQTQRDAWEGVAAAARMDAASKINAEVEMLRAANQAWQTRDEEWRRTFERFDKP
jgi:hypothetical protein